MCGPVLVLILAHFVNSVTDQLPSPKEVYTLQQPNKKHTNLRSTQNPLFRYGLRMESENFVSITTANGLPSNDVTGSVVDDLGNLWIATLGGVGKYNGYNIKLFTTQNGLSHNRVLCLLKDRHGSIWFGTDGGGVVCYDGYSFKNYTSKDGLCSNSIISLFQDRTGIIWLGSGGNGVSRYDGKKFTNYFIGADSSKSYSVVSAINEDTEHNIWFGTYNNGCVKYDGKQFYSYNRSLGLPSMSVSAMAVGRNIPILVATSNGLVLNDNGFFRSIQLPIVESESISSLFYDRSGNVWIATANSGLFIYSPKEEQKLKFVGLKNKSIVNINEDTNGNIWISTIGSGLYRYVGNQILFKVNDSEQHNNISAIGQDGNGSIWLGIVNEGAVMSDGENLTYFNTKNGLAGNWVTDFLVDAQKDLWVATSKGISIYNGKVFRPFSGNRYLGPYPIGCLFQDSKGAIWIGTLGGGIVKYFNGAFHSYTVNDGLPSNSIADINEDKNGNIWLATKDKGVCRYNGVAFTSFSDHDGIANNKITSIINDFGGNIWCGSFSGISRYDGTTWLSFSNGVAASDGIVYGVLQDESGVIWVETNLGYSALYFKDFQGSIVPAGRLEQSNTTLKSTYTPVHKIVLNETTLLASKSTINSFYLTKAAGGNGKIPKGLMLNGKASYLSVFDRDSTNTSSNQQNLLMEEIKLHRNKVNWKLLELYAGKSVDSAQIMQHEKMFFGRWLTKNERDSLAHQFRGVVFDSVTRFNNIPLSLVIPYRHNQISFSFTLNNITASLPPTYQYQLLGLEEQWHQVTEGEIAFDNLWEGHYSFNVRAQNAEGIWLEPLSYQFTILPPWWRTWWMYAVYLIVLSVFFWSLAWLSKRNLARNNLRLQELVEIRTSELYQQKLEAEQQKALIEEKNEEIKSQLEQASKDLSIQTFQMVHKYNTLNALEEEIRKMALSGDKEKFNKLLSMIGFNKSLEKEWEIYDSYFNNVHKEFYKNLLNRTPQLSKYEQRMCALIKMGLDNKEISQLLNIEVSSVKMAKYRLKKRLNLSESQDLSEFISTI